METYSFDRIFDKLHKYCVLNKRHNIINYYKRKKYFKLIEMSKLCLMEEENRKQFLMHCLASSSVSKIDCKIIIDVISNNIDKIEDFFNIDSCNSKAYLRGFDALMQYISLDIMMCNGDNELSKFVQLFSDIYVGTPDEWFKTSDINCTLGYSEKYSVFKSILRLGRIKPEDVKECIAIVGNAFDDKDLIDKYSKELLAVSTTPIENLRQLKELGLDSEEVKRVVDGRMDAVLNEICGGNEIFELMVKEIIEREKIRVSEIYAIGEGAYLTAFCVGSKVVKIGDNAAQYNIAHNSKRFLQPIVRFQNNGKRIEILEKVDIDFSITEAELYEVYKDVRKDGMIWTDVAVCNVGRLTKDNIAHLTNDIHLENGEKVKRNIVPYGPNLGFDSDAEIGEPLKEGDIVILDLDFIYPEDSKEIRWGNIWGREFEYRYKKEKYELDSDRESKEIKLER